MQDQVRETRGRRLEKAPGGGKFPQLVFAWVAPVFITEHSIHSFIHSCPHSTDTHSPSLCAGYQGYNQDLERGGSLPPGDHIVGGRGRAGATDGTLESAVTADCRAAAAEGGQGRPLRRHPKEDRRYSPNVQNRGSG